MQRLVHKNIQTWKHCCNVTVIPVIFGNYVSKRINTIVDAPSVKHLHGENIDILCENISIWTIMLHR